MVPVGPNGTSGAALGNKLKYNEGEVLLDLRNQRIWCTKAIVLCITLECYIYHGLEFATLGNGNLHG